MRSLTPSEAIVLRSMLAARPGPESSRIIASGVPRRTYQEIRRRAIAEGWAYERFVPDGPFFGWPYVTFALVHPYLEHFDDDLRRWTEDQSLVHLWRSRETLFGVFFSNKRLQVNGLFRRRFVLSVDARGPSVPAYFDFEGAWARWTRQHGTLAYPQSLPGALRTPTRSRSPATHAREFAHARELELLQLRKADGRRASQSELLLPRRLRSVVRAGSLRYRVFLNLERLPAFEDKSIRGIALVQGEFLPEQRPEELFHSLVVEAGVSPFLYATDGRTVLIGALSVDQARLERRSVLDTIRGYLGSIEVNREELRTLATPVAHQYQRLFERPNVGSPGSDP